jgi:hypothetical protein
MTLRAVLGLAAVAVVAAAGTLRMDTRRDVVVQESRDPALRMRASSPLLVPMSNLVVQYRVNVSIGTPPQDLTLAVDTGSSDVWIPDAEACGPDSKSACAGGYCKSIPRAFLLAASSRSLQLRPRARARLKKFRPGLTSNTSTELVRRAITSLTLSR